MTIISPRDLAAFVKPLPSAAQKRLADAREAVQTLAALKSKASQSLAAPLAINDASKAIENSTKQARLEARGLAKARAKETIERLKKEVELIKRLWAHDAKQMAKHLARVGKDLKAAVKDYAKAANENGADAAALRQDLAAIPAASPSNKRGDSATQPVDSAAAAVAPDQPTADQPTVEQPTVDQAAVVSPAAASVYQAQDRSDKVKDLKDRIAEAKGDLTFVGEVRDLIKKIRELMQEAKVKSYFDAKDKTEKDEAVKLFETSMADLEDALGELESDIRDDFPELSTGIEISA